MIAEYLKERRWFRGKARPLRDATIEERYPLDLAGAGGGVDLAVVRASYEDGTIERYVLVGETDATTHRDALTNPTLLSSLVEKFRDGGTRIEGERGTLVFRPSPSFDAVKGTSAVPKPSTKEQTNTSVPFGDTYILKIVRKLDEGRSAELEMGDFLTQNGYASAPPVLGAIEIERGEGREPATVGIVHRFLANRGDAWGFTLDELARSKDPQAYVPRATLLGRRVAEMHAVLARGRGPRFEPEPIGRDRRVALADAVRASARAIEKHLGPGDEAKIDARVRAFVEREGDPIATRVHGDLHLGQILVTEGGDDFVIIDFEGEPARPLEERRAKRSPLADVAGMLRSFHYAAETAKVGAAWYRTVCAAFLGAYGDVPRDVLDFYLIEKCIYEIEYEANNRPDWIDVPRRGLVELLG